IQARDVLNKGVAAFRSANYQSAVQFFKQAVDLDPNLGVAELYLATAYAQQFVPNAKTSENAAYAANAIAMFQRILQRNPNDVNALAGLASIYQNSNDLQNARATYVIITKADPQNPVPFYSIGSIDWLLVYDKQNPLPLADQDRLVDEGLASL